VAAINLNGIAIHTRIRMVEDFLRIHDIVIALLQEVTSHQTDTLRRYIKHINIGIEQQGTPILAQRNLPHTNIKRLPSGRGIATSFNWTCWLNI